MWRVGVFAFASPTNISEKGLRGVSNKTITMVINAALEDIFCPISDSPARRSKALALNYPAAGGNQNSP